MRLSLVMVNGAPKRAAIVANQVEMQTRVPDALQRET
jgi:hypothetical protein